jgi:hypothetical protein
MLMDRIMGVASGGKASTSAMQEGNTEAQFGAKH